jgi:hypothetical protein
MGGVVSGLADSIGGAVSDAGSFLDDAAHQAAPIVGAYYGIPPSLTNAALNMGGGGGGSAPRPVMQGGGNGLGGTGLSGGNYNYANNYLPAQGGYGVGGSMMGPAQQDSSQGMFSQLLPFLLASGGGLQQQQVNKEAAQTQADALRAAGQQASQSAQFRPVGTTTTFGTSNFQVDPTTGQLTSAGYNLSPQLQQYQNTLMAGGQQSLTDAANLQNLGRGYIAQSPEAAAQQYMTAQQALLAPSRDTESARLANQLQQTGRTGVSVAQGGNLGMANPEQQALANARAMQDLQLAAQAQAQGRAQTQFGQGLLTSAYDPFQAGLKTAGSVEALGQQPFGLSTDLAKQSSAAGANAGRFGLAANMSAADAMLRANQVSPFADIMSALGKTPTATSALGGALGGVLGGLFGGGSGGQQGGGVDLSGLGGYLPNFNSDSLNFGGYTGGGTNVYNPDAFSLGGDYGSAADTFDFSSWF